MSGGLEIRDLKVMYGGVTALAGVDIDVPPGAFVSVLGANGAGKTTLVRSITGLLYLHRGRVRGGTITLDGESVLGQKSAAARRRSCRNSHRRPLPQAKRAKQQLYRPEAA